MDVGALMLTWPPCPQGVYVFAVYFVMHNQLCWPTKASYTVEMSGHQGPDSSFQGGGPASAGGDINKSTQNLISAMEEVKPAPPSFPAVPGGGKSFELV